MLHEWGKSQGCLGFFTQPQALNNWCCASRTLLPASSYERLTTPPSLRPNPPTPDPHSVGQDRIHDEWLLFSCSQLCRMQTALSKVRSSLTFISTYRLVITAFGEKSRLCYKVRCMWNGGAGYISLNWNSSWLIVSVPQLWFACFSFLANLADWDDHVFYVIQCSGRVLISHPHWLEFLDHSINLLHHNHYSMKWRCFVPKWLGLWYFKKKISSRLENPNLPSSKINDKDPTGGKMTTEPLPWGHSTGTQLNTESILN